MDPWWGDRLTVSDAFAQGYMDGPGVLEDLDRCVMEHLIARNVVRESWRRWHRERSLVRSRDPQAGRFEGAVELMDLVGRLSWREREVIVLHYIADLPVHVMATMLGVSITAVKSRLFRARSRLRTDYLDAEGTRHATE
ncbi:MAG: RNA polymerase sigma factor [Clostridia bacterium]